MNSDLDWSKARLQVIEIILNGWTALDLQIQHNPQDLACRKWLPEPISEAIIDDPSIEEMEEWLCGLLDTNFNLICEDNSCFEVARKMVEMERIIKRKDQTKIEEFVNRLPKASGVGASMSNLGHHGESSSEEEEEEVETNINATKSHKRKELPNEDDMDVEEGWSVAR